MTETIKVHPPQDLQNKIALQNLKLSMHGMVYCLTCQKIVCIDNHVKH